METISAVRAAIKLSYNNKSMILTEKAADSVEDLLRSFEYTDFLTGQVDDLQMSFVDPHGKWCREWHPAIGAKLTASILLSEGDIERELPCGDFNIDCPGYKAPGVISIRGCPSAVTTNLRRETKTRLWKSITLKHLATKIASEQSLRIHFVGDDTPPIGKIEQKNESNLKFLTRICKNEGYALKVGNGKTDGSAIVIQKLSSIDAQAAILTIDRATDEIIDWSFSEDGSNTYSACKVVYKHKDKGLLSATYRDPNQTGNGQTLIIRQHCADHAEAMRVAKAKLEEANRSRYTCDMTLPGVRTMRDDVWFVSGLVVNLIGWGVYDGNYTIDEVKHSIAGGYTATLKLSRKQ